MNRKKPMEYPKGPMPPIMLDGEIPPYNVRKSSTPKPAPSKSELPK